MLKSSDPLETMTKSRGKRVIAAYLESKQSNSRTTFEELFCQDRVVGEGSKLLSPIRLIQQE